MLALSNYTYHHEPEPAHSLLSFSTSKYQRKKKSYTKQLNKGKASGKSSLSAYYRRKYDIKKNKSSSKESNFRNERFILDDILDDLRAECGGDFHDLVPYSINSVHYTHNIRPRLCLLCKTVTSADMSHIHHVECSECLTHLQQVHTVADASIGDGRSLRVCSACLSNYSLCKSEVSADCAYLRCFYCKQNQKEQQHQQQVSPASFVLEDIGCNACRQYLGEMTNTFVRYRCYVCLSCCAGHSLCCEKLKLLNLTWRRHCHYGCCTVCKGVAFTSKSQHYRRRFCAECKRFFCKDSCGRDELCKNCMAKREERPVIAWLEDQMSGSYCEDIKQIVLRYLSSTILHCEGCDGEVEVRSFTELRFGTDINGATISVYFVDERYKRNVVHNANDLFARNQRYAVVYCSRCVRRGRHGDLRTCAFGDCRNHIYARSSGYGGGGGYGYGYDRYQAGPGNKRRCNRNRDYCLNHPMCAMPNCGTICFTKPQMSKRRYCDDYDERPSSYCTSCEFVVCSDCTNDYRWRHDMSSYVPSLIHAEHKQCRGCYDQRREAASLCELKSALISCVFDAFVFDPQSHFDDDLTTVASALFEFYNGYTVDCARCKHKSVFLNADDVEQEKTVNPYPPNSTYFYSVSKKCIRAYQAQQSLVRLENRKKNANENENSSAYSYSYIDFLDAYVCAFCVDCTSYIVRDNSRTTPLRCIEVGRGCQSLVSCAGERCLAHRMIQFKCHECKQRLVEIDRENFDFFKTDHFCPQCKRWLCGNCYDFERGHDCMQELMETPLTLLNRAYEFDHEFVKCGRIPRKENYGKKSTIKRCKNRIKRKAHYQGKADKKQNAVARNKWNKRYLADEKSAHV